MDAKFRRGGSEISFGLTKVRGQCNEISWRALGDFSLEQRTNLANCALIFLHSTVSVQSFSLPPCRRRQYCRFYSLVPEYSLYVYLVTGRGTFQLLILMPLLIIPRYRIVHSLTHPRSLILVTDRVQTLILSWCLEQILTVTIEMKAYEQCFCMVLRGRKMKFQRFRVYCLNES